MAERLFEFVNYRNLGITVLHENQRRTQFLVNTTVDQNDLGNVIYVIGPNNSGKSNVLSGVKAYATGTIAGSDKPDFLDIDSKPTISFVVRDGEYEYRLDRIFQQNTPLVPSLSKNGELLSTGEIIVKQEHMSFLNRWAEFAINNLRERKFTQQMAQLRSTQGVLPISNWKEVFSETDNLLKAQFGGDNYCQNYFSITHENALGVFSSIIEQSNKNIPVDFKRQYGYDFIPTVHTLQNKLFSQKQFVATNDQLVSSDFFKYLFASIDYDIAKVTGAYAKFRENSTIGTLIELTKKLNEKLTKLAKRFNRLYLLEKNQYKFEIVLESSKVFFQIYLADSGKSTPLNYDIQSTGFKWFFDFFFTLIAQSNFKKGDIVLMDEPATNLHVSGIEELRNYLEEYAKRSGLVFIITTHSPFFIHTDHLEGVRVVYRDNEEAMISNKFHMLGTNDIDSIKPIQKALTVSRHVLVNPLSKVVFVEGITDYCYLTAFKNLFNMKDLTFLPIQGLNDDTKKHALKSEDDLFNTMLSIHHQPLLLVDADRAGVEAEKIAKNNYKGRIEVTKLSDFDPAFTSIESLFAAEDKPTDKSFNSAVNLKRNVENIKWKQATLDNFKKVLDAYIIK